MSMNWRSSRLFFGGAILWMAFTLAVKGWIPSRDIQYPRYSKPSLAKKDLLALTFGPASFNLANTFSSLQVVFR
jgi:hypothetical protein